MQHNVFVYGSYSILSSMATYFVYGLNFYRKKLSNLFYGGYYDKTMFIMQC